MKKLFALLVIVALGAVGCDSKKETNTSKSGGGSGSSGATKTS